MLKFCDFLFFCRSVYRSVQTTRKSITFAKNLPMPKHHQYFVYIATNKYKTVLYTGVTNNSIRRQSEHEQNSIQGKKRTFTGRYNAYHIVYFEEHKYILNAIAREKEIKKWYRAAKIELIEQFNPEWEFYLEGYDDERE